MLVNGKHLTTIWYEKDHDTVKIIDQRVLPHELKIIDINSISDVAFAIKEMQVRGAPLIGITAAFGMYVASRENSNLNYLEQVAKDYKSTRHTAVNLSWAIDFIFSKCAISF